MNKGSRYRNIEELKAFFSIDNAVCEATPNLDIAPAQEVLAIIRHAGENRLDKFHWGLVPFWAKDVSIGTRLINARVETIAEKPSFRNAFKSRRCLIPADGFYEWKGDTGQRQPFFITLPDQKLFAFAGLWETWQNKDGQDAIYKSCTIITTRASQSFSMIHHRMPVILKPQVYKQWLDPENQNTVKLIDILKNNIVTELVSYPRKKPNGSTRQDGPSRMVAVGKPQQTTFVWPDPKDPTLKK